MDQIDEKDKVEAYQKLYERQMAHYENTQAIEWKVAGISISVAQGVPAGDILSFGVELEVVAGDDVRFVVEVPEAARMRTRPGRGWASPPEVSVGAPKDSQYFRRGWPSRCQPPSPRADRNQPSPSAGS